MPKQSNSNLRGVSRQPHHTEWDGHLRNPACRRDSRCSPPLPTPLRLEGSPSGQVLRLGAYRVYKKSKIFSLRHTRLTNRIDDDSHIIVVFQQSTPLCLLGTDQGGFWIGAFKSHIKLARIVAEVGCCLKREMLLPIGSSKLIYRRSLLPASIDKLPINQRWAICKYGRNRCRISRAYLTADDRQWEKAIYNK